MEGRTTLKGHAEDGKSTNGKSDHVEENFSDAELTVIQMEYSAVRVLIEVIIPDSLSHLSRL